MADKIYFFDTSLRDGEQTPGISLTPREKLSIAERLEELGIDIIEAGFPASSNADMQAVSLIAQRIRNSTVAAFCRARIQDIDKAWEALCAAESPRLHVCIATSPLHMEYKLKMQPDEVLRLITESVSHAKKYCSDVQFSAEDAARSDLEFLSRAFELAIEAGATTLNIPDTVGYCEPEEFYNIVRNCMERTRGIEKAVVAVHCHNDLGNAVANTLAGIRAGARQAECTLNGTGERAGNAALEEILMNLHARQDHYGLVHRIVLPNLYRTCHAVAAAMGWDVPVNKPVVGENAFRHGSGIHQHGILANRSTYQIMTPEDIGAGDAGLVLGKLSGSHAFAQRLSELGFNPDEEKLAEAFAGFKLLAEQKKNITDRDIESLMGKSAGRTTRKYSLESFQIQSGNGIASIAGVKITTREGKDLTAAGVGSGPVNALFKAIDIATGQSPALEQYRLRAMNEGADALGEVTVRINTDGNSYTGRGLSTDILEASALAYINALNRTVL